METDPQLRAALEAVQSENKRLAARVLELELSAAELPALRSEVVWLRSQLEGADEIRTSWHERLQSVQRQLCVAHEEHTRLRRVLENQTAELMLARRGRGP